MEILHPDINPIICHKDYYVKYKDDSFSNFILFPVIDGESELSDLDKNMSEYEDITFEGTPLSACFSFGVG